MDVDAASMDGTVPVLVAGLHPKSSPIVDASGGLEYRPAIIRIMGTVPTCRTGVVHIPPSASCLDGRAYLGTWVPSYVHTYIYSERVYSSLHGSIHTSIPGSALCPLTPLLPTYN